MLFEISVTQPLSTPNTLSPLQEIILDLWWLGYTWSTLVESTLAQSYAMHWVLYVKIMIYVLYIQFNFVLFTGKALIIWMYCMKGRKKTMFSHPGQGEGSPNRIMGQPFHIWGQPIPRINGHMGLKRTKLTLRLTFCFQFWCLGAKQSTPTASQLATHLNRSKLCW